VSLAIGLLSLVAVGGAGDALVERVIEAPTPASLRAWHDLLGEEPHVAGSEGDHRVIAKIAEAFEAMGLETEVWSFEALLPRPISASVTIIGDTTPPPSLTRPGRRGIGSLALSEKELLADPATSHPDLDWGWNAFSGSGVVEGEVVYVNQGRKEDFERLRSLDIDLTGKIAFARYGGNYRGFKAKFAEEAGAAGLLMYLDPGDYGFARGETWPTGGWANETCIQRGSILTLPYKGDPLTPFEPARPGVERLSVDSVALPRIPVQPIGYAAAERIMAGMTGRKVERDSWRGGMQVPYRIEGGSMRVRVEVEQSRELGETANVIGILRGAEAPEHLVIVGCHHDAWGFGAADPLAGTIVLMETAKTFAEAAKAGLRPRRTIIFAAWGAEEFGIIGSSEWCEGHRAVLGSNAVAYINLDMAAMGSNFSASATPPLHAAVLRAAGLVPQAGAEATTVLARWSAEGTPRIGTPGGGSDHVGFNCHLGVPACSLHGGGSEGTAYHSNYDTLAWYRATVGEDYEPAVMIARICGALVADLADSAIVPLDPRAVVVELHRRLPRLKAAAEAVALPLDIRPLEQAVVELASIAAAVGLGLDSASVDHPNRQRVNRAVIALERSWLEEEGLPGRPWFRNTYCTSNRHSGYGAVVLPLLAEAIEDRDPLAAKKAVLRYEGRVRALSAALEAIEAMLKKNP
jgi:N-acetylated-alpha-linked acidic dipeptidase